jgi:hypothetical protein
MIEDWCDASELLCFFLSSGPLAVLAWVSFLVTSGGLALALCQISKVSKAANAAANAISDLKLHIDGVNLAYVNAQLNTISIVARSSDYVLAQSLFSPLKRSVRLQAHAMGTSQLDLDGLNRVMGAIDKHLEWGRGGAAKYSAHVLQRSIDELVATVTSWEAQIEHVARTEKSIENN